MLKTIGKLTFKLVIIALLSFVLPQEAKAQTVRINDAGPAKTAEGVPIIHHGQEIGFSFTNLSPNKIYRIEIGTADSRNKYTKLVFEIDSSGRCTNRSESDKNAAQTISYSPCTSRFLPVGGGSLLVNMQGTIKATKDLLPAPTTDAQTVKLYLIEEEDDVGKGTEPEKNPGGTAFIVLPPPQLAVTDETGNDQPKIAKGAPVFIGAGMLLPKTSYRLRTLDKDGTVLSGSEVALTPGSLGAECAAFGTQGIYTEATPCTQRNAFGYYLKIADTNSIDCSPSENNSSGEECTVILEQITGSTPKLSTQARFNIVTDQFTIVIDIPQDAKVSDGLELDGTFSQEEDYRFYEGKNVTVNVYGCPAEKVVTLSWWREEKANCKEGGACNPQGDPEGQREKTTQNGSATFDKLSFQADGQSDIYYMTAVCDGSHQNGFADVLFRVWGQGEEFIVVPETINENTPWKVTLGGLDKYHGQLRDTQKICYYFIIKQGDSPVQNTISDRDQCLDTKFNVEDIDEFAQNAYYIASTHWTDDGKHQADVDVQGLAAGNYTIQLYSINGTEDDPKAERQFCVSGANTPCVNQSKMLAEKPLPPPCASEIAVDTGKCTLVDTVFGPLSTEPALFVGTILGILLSVSGIIALLLIIRSGYQIMMSSGNPEAIQEAKERLTSAIVGLLFIIFSLVILQVIGVDILRIPGFTATP